VRSRHLNLGESTESSVRNTFAIVEIHMAGKNARDFLYSWGSATRQHPF
jgi:hypothetical protein